MTVETWLESAIADAERRGLKPLPALLEMLARSTVALRVADLELRSESQPDEASTSQKDP
jgi:hypothetical protein